MDTEPKNHGPALKPPPKKYTPPVMTHYGSIKDITKSKGPQGQPDSGTSPRDKTSI
jgi:hypothetical protein